MNTAESQENNTATAPAGAVDSAANGAVDNIESADGGETKATETPEKVEVLLGGDSGEKDKEEISETKIEGAPDEYTIDEGVDLELDADLLSGLSPALKESNISNKQFNALAKAHVEQSNRLKGQRMNEMAKQTMDDPLFSGEEGKANISIANDAVVEYGGKQLSKVLKETGMGNNLAVVKAFYEIGMAMQEDNPTGATATNSGYDGDMSAEDIMYPAM